MEEALADYETNYLQGNHHDPGGNGVSHLVSVMPYPGNSIVHQIRSKNVKIIDNSSDFSSCNVSSTGFDQDLIVSFKDHRTNIQIAHQRSCFWKRQDRRDIVGNDLNNRSWPAWLRRSLFQPSSLATTFSLSHLRSCILDPPLSAGTPRHLPGLDEIGMLVIDEIRLLVLRSTLRPQIIPDLVRFAFQPEAF